jgi:hypothetical protein
MGTKAPKAEKAVAADPADQDQAAVDQASESAAQAEDQDDLVGEIDPNDLVAEITGRQDEAALDLMLYVCARLGVNPSKSVKPVELLSWRWIGGNGEGPDAVQVVTAGGLKVKLFEDPDWPLEAATEQALRKALALFRVDKNTKEVVALPIPADITLPRQHVDGLPTGAARASYSYKGGYLKNGGKLEAARRAALRKKQ